MRNTTTRVGTVEITSYAIDDTVVLSSSSVLGASDKSDDKEDDGHGDEVDEAALEMARRMQNGFEAVVSQQQGRNREASVTEAKSHFDGTSRFVWKADDNAYVEDAPEGSDDEALSDLSEPEHELFTKTAVGKIAQASSTSGAPSASSTQVVSECASSVKAPPPPETATASIASSSSSAPVIATAAATATPEALPPTTSASSSPDHKPWWLTRTSRKATCAGCRLDINSHEFRLLCEPDPKNVADRRVWRKVWWYYYHVVSSCVAHQSTPLRHASELQCDVAPLPRSRRESVSEYNERVDEAVANALGALTTCGLLKS